MIRILNPLRQFVSSCRKNQGLLLKAKMVRYSTAQVFTKLVIHSNQSRFCDSLDSSDEICPDLPSNDDLRSFWSGTWEVPVQYNKDALRLIKVLLLLQE